MMKKAEQRPEVKRLLNKLETVSEIRYLIHNKQGIKANGVLLKATSFLLPATVVLVGLYRLTDMAVWGKGLLISIAVSVGLVVFSWFRKLLKHISEAMSTIDSTLAHYEPLDTEAFVALQKRILDGESDIEQCILEWCRTERDTIDLLLRREEARDASSGLPCFLSRDL
ncbi:hypothetical protein GCM10009425_40190 [Pseudomonas asuensis]|uniref:SLATT domain-containing protein n=1 Tax=Pseudomonas asuensis TaxID=1825787 RepID=A0ABQ2H2G6_9PSED|nr:hypothetical protein [Pseudomonas asuensis]GGM25393.1 hypothetical protein GCM10009425_40190 [Pseudomonas asuensis]